MKVLRHGAIPEDRYFRTSCYRCQSVFEFQQFEGKVVDDQRDGSYVSIDCPVCGNDCYVLLSKGEHRVMT